VHDHAARELEGGVGRVVRGGLVLLALFIPAVWDMRGAEAAHGVHLAEEVVHHIAPVAQHVDDDAAAIRGPVVPRGALRGLIFAGEYPVAEVPLDGKYTPEEARTY